MKSCFFGCLLDWIFFLHVFSLRNLLLLFFLFFFSFFLSFYLVVFQCHKYFSRIFSCWLVVLCSLKQISMASRPADISPLPNGIPSGRQTVFILSGHLSRHTVNVACTSPSPPPTLCLSLSLTLCLCLCLSVSLPLPLCLCLCLSLSLCLTHCAS